MKLKFDIMETAHQKFSTRKSTLIEKYPEKHFPNKNESKKLRQIMSETGLTEEKIREDKKYRIELSNAQKEGLNAKHNQVDKWYLNRVKDACKITGLVPRHPNTI